MTEILIRPVLEGPSAPTPDWQPAALTFDGTHDGFNLALRGNLAWQLPWKGGPWTLVGYELVLTVEDARDVHLVRTAGYQTLEAGTRLEMRL